MTYARRHGYQGQRSMLGGRVAAAVATAPAPRARKPGALWEVKR